MEGMCPGSFEECSRPDGVVYYWFSKHGVLFPVLDLDASTSNCRPSAYKLPQVLHCSLRGISISQLCLISIRLSFDVIFGTKFSSSGVRRVYLCDTKAKFPVKV